MRAPVSDFVLGLGADTPTSAVERLKAKPLTAAERRLAAQVRKLIQGLPAGGSVLVVHSPTVVSAYREAIVDVRGPVVAAATRVLAAPNLIDEEAVTRGLALPVFRAPVVEMQREHRRALAQAWRG